MTPPTNDELANRFLHHAPKGDQAFRYSVIRDACLTLAKLIRDNTPACAEQAGAIDCVDTAMMLACAAIARHE